jgi:hypothetical protein
LGEQQFARLSASGASLISSFEAQATQCPVVAWDFFNPCHLLEKNIKSRALAFIRQEMFLL